MEHLRTEAMMTTQERIIKYLKAMRRNLPRMDFQVYKDLTYCIDAVTEGELQSIDLKKDKLIAQQQKMQQFKKNRRYSVAAVPNFDGLMWAQTYQG